MYYQVVQGYARNFFRTQCRVDLADSQVNQLIAYLMNSRRYACGRTIHWSHIEYMDVLLIDMQLTVFLSNFRMVLSPAMDQ